MKFKVLPHGRRVSSSPRDTVYLITDNWNDWGKYRTLYQLHYVDDTGEDHSIGDVKIGQRGMKPKDTRPDLPSLFDALDENFFSVGQDDSYYEALNKLGEEKRAHILNSLRDMAADPSVYDIAKGEDVTSESLMRSVTQVSIEGQLRRIAAGGARLTKYAFKYVYQDLQEAEEPLSLAFNVVPDSQPPTNIHVIIGSNGVGKTRLLNYMAKCLLAVKPDSKQVGKFTDEDGNLKGPKLFANLVSVTFSAFDRFEPISFKKGDAQRIMYSYVGLKTSEEDAASEGGRPKALSKLTEEFADSVSNCLASAGAKAARWRRSLQTLEADPIFREAEVAELAEPGSDTELRNRATQLFSNFSSGHKIVLLSITKLVEVVEESTLVLLDEPEAHLHPPLLAAFIRALSDLLIDRNGVAIIATHSPVVLQEVPKTCAWKLFRSGSVVEAGRPELETFGENVGTLTREVFGLEVTHSGFHRMLQEAVDKSGDYESVLDAFRGKLGAEAKGIVRALLATKKR